MSWLLSYYTRQGFHVVSAKYMLFMALNIQMRSEIVEKIVTEVVEVVKTEVVEVAGTPQVVE